MNFTKNTKYQLSKKSIRSLNEGASPWSIVASVVACYHLLIFIDLKMELHWRSNPVGRICISFLFSK